MIEDEQDQPAPGQGRLRPTVGIFAVGTVSVLLVAGGLIAHTSDSMGPSAGDVSQVQLAAPDFIGEVQQQLGPSKFGGAWILPAAGGEVVHVGVTSPDSASLAIVTAAAAKYGLSNDLSVDAVRYSAQQLDGFYVKVQEVIGQWPSTEGILGFGVRPELNGVELRLSSTQLELVNQITAVIPSDVLQVTVIPGATVTAL